MTRNNLSRNTKFCYESFVPRPNFLLEYYTIDGKERKLFDSEISVYMAIMTFVHLSESNPQFQNEDGIPFCGASQASIGEKANGASRMSVNRATKALSSAGLIYIEKSTSKSVDRIYLLEKGNDGKKQTDVTSSSKGLSHEVTTACNVTLPHDVTPRSTIYIESNNIELSKIDSKDIDKKHEPLSVADIYYGLGDPSVSHDEPKHDTENDTTPERKESAESLPSKVGPNPQPADQTEFKANNVWTEPNMTDTPGKIKKEFILNAIDLIASEICEGYSKDYPDVTPESIRKKLLDQSMENGYPELGIGYITHKVVAKAMGDMGVHDSYHGLWALDCEQYA